MKKENGNKVLIRELKGRNLRVSVENAFLWGYILGDKGKRAKDCGLSEEFRNYLRASL